MPRLVLLPISISALPPLQHPLAIRGTMTWLGFTPLHFIVDGSLQQMVPYLWRTQREERDESLQTLRILPSPPPPPHCPARKERKQIMWTRSWLMQYRWSSAFLTPALESLEISALTLSICTSCVNTKMVGVKTLPRKKKMSTHLVRPLSSLQCTLAMALRPLFSSAPCSSKQEGVRLLCGNGEQTSWSNSI